jgi:hypothetical protein
MGTNSVATAIAALVAKPERKKRVMDILLEKRI